ncbi:MAG: DpnD/PcfM family protein [Prevotellaceae bacterium]|jgi:hypothetical protein|nr:DpnD/PcfM family protein [Prevotellaceae bacterium]
MELKKIQVEISEINTIVVEMEAETNEDALKLAEKLYKNGEIVLNSSDFADYTISLI